MYEALSYVRQRFSPHSTDTCRCRQHAEGGWHPAHPAHPTNPANPAKKTVAIFCLHRTPDAAGGRWGTSSLEQRGIGGSEEAVILVSRELVALRYHVEVLQARLH